jgi:hypothetical protein
VSAPARAGGSLWAWSVALYYQNDNEHAQDALARALSIQEKALRADLGGVRCGGRMKATLRLPTIHPAGMTSKGICRIGS